MHDLSWVVLVPPKLVRGFSRRNPPPTKAAYVIFAAPSRDRSGPSFMQQAAKAQVSTRTGCRASASGFDHLVALIDTRSLALHRKVVLRAKAKINSMVGRPKAGRYATSARRKPVEELVTPAGADVAARIAQDAVTGRGVAGVRAIDTESSASLVVEFWARRVMGQLIASRLRQRAFAHARDSE